MTALPERRSEPEETAFARLLDIVLPGGGYVAAIEAYFDESQNGDYLCVAGCVFEKEAAKAFEADWNANLDHYGLSHFHMVDCAHGVEEFSRLSGPQRITAARHAIRAIRKHVTMFSSAAVRLSDFADTLKGNPLSGSAYAFCGYTVMLGVSTWADDNDYTGTVSYFFEQGGPKRGSPENMMTFLQDHPDWQVSTRRGPITFIEKRDAAAVQAADILVWHQAKRHIGDEENRELRADYRALVRNENDEKYLHIWSRESLADFATTGWRK